jgi:hypothetical protein
MTSPLAEALFPEGRFSNFSIGAGTRRCFLEKKNVSGSAVVFTTNPVCERRVDLLVCSIPLHRQ